MGSALYVGFQSKLYCYVKLTYFEHRLSTSLMRKNEENQYLKSKYLEISQSLESVEQL